MGSMVFSTLRMFAPFWAQVVVFIVIAVGFRVYVSHEERKKRGETRRKAGGSSMAKRNGFSGPASMGGFIAGAILTVVGLPLISPFLLVFGIFLMIRNREAVTEKVKKSARYKRAAQKPPVPTGRSPQSRPMGPVPPGPARPAPRRQAGVSYQSNARDHYHITNVGLSVERRLEQLEVMKNAGLLDKEEYEQRLRKILRDK